METKDLIKAISSDARASERPLRALLLYACIAASCVAAVVFAVLLGPRPDFAAAAETPRFLLKFVITAVLAATALVQVAILARPGGHPGARAAWLAIAPLLVLAAVLVEFATVPAVDWRARWIGTNALLCLTFIPLIGIGPLAVFLAALRRAAPTRPALAGAAAGLLSGGLAATFYAAHCFDDSPFFVATWYSLAIVILALVGAGVGRVVLRW